MKLNELKGKRHRHIEDKEVAEIQDNLTQQVLQVENMLNGFIENEKVRHIHHHN